MFGQLGGGGRYVYPLVRFNVYTDPISDDVSFVDLQGVTADGDRMLVSGPELFPSLRSGRFDSFHTTLLSASGVNSKEGPDERSRGFDNYRRFLLSLVDRYNDDHSSRPIVALEAVTHNVPHVPEISDHRDEVTSRLLLTVNADGTFTLPTPQTSQSPR